METLTTEIYKGQFYWLQSKIAEINKKADKLGTPPLTLETGAERIQEIGPDDFKPYKRVKVWIEITLKYEIPIINGWKLAARFELETTAATSDIFSYKMPGATLPPEHLNKKDINCDHCGHRRHRKKSYLLHHQETGEYKEVGSTCIKDFFGHDPTRFVFWAEIDPAHLLVNMPEDFDPDAYREYSGDNILPLHNYLTVSAACIDAYGWTSRSANYDDPTGHPYPTANQALDLITNPNIKKEDRPDIEDKHRDQAAQAIKYFKHLDPGEEDYLINCQKIARRKYTTPKTAGYAASMIISYRMHVKRQLLEEEKAKRPPSNWLGEVKQRLTVPVKCIFVTTIDSYYGPSDLYIFIDDQGNKIKTFYSGNTWSIEQGETADLTGTIKDLETYKGEKVTILTRCKIN